MIKFLLVTLLVFALAASAAILAAVTQSKRAKTAEKNYGDLHETFLQIKEEAERCRKALGETSKAEEAANAERKELAQAPDGGLVGRANNLFNKRL